MLFQRKKQKNQRESSVRRNYGKNGKKEMIDRNTNKKERTCSLYRRITSPPIGEILPHSSEKVSLCALWKRMRKASLAVETALVLPLFFLGLITMISFMDIYKVQTEHLQNLCEKAKEAGMYAYVLEGGGTREITLPDVYAYEPVGTLIPLAKVWMHNTVKVHAWTGADKSEYTKEQYEPEKMVYVAENGSVYHKKPGCRYLNVKVSQVAGSGITSRRNSYGEKYSPCETCSRNQHPAGTVYITSSGNRYHNLASCSGLKRTVRLVKESELGSMHACSKCG